MTNLEPSEPEREAGYPLIRCEESHDHHGVGKNEDSRDHHGGIGKMNIPMTIMESGKMKIPMTIELGK